MRRLVALARSRTELRQTLANLVAENPTHVCASSSSLKLKSNSTTGWDDLVRIKMTRSYSSTVLANSFEKQLTLNGEDPVEMKRCYLKLAKDYHPDGSSSCNLIL
jgi:hypothetical protein